MNRKLKVGDKVIMLQDTVSSLKKGDITTIIGMTSVKDCPYYLKEECINRYAPYRYKYEKIVAKNSIGGKLIC